MTGNPRALDKVNFINILQNKKQSKIEVDDLDTILSNKDHWDKLITELTIDNFAKFYLEDFEKLMDFPDLESKLEKHNVLKTEFEKFKSKIKINIILSKGASSATDFITALLILLNPDNKFDLELVSQVLDRSGEKHGDKDFFVILHGNATGSNIFNPNWSVVGTNTEKVSV